jgi:AraC family transcriptional regulator
MTPRIETSTGKLLIGKRSTMSLAHHKVDELWKSFMPKRNEITTNLSNELISLTVYKPTYFINFNPNNEFERWATVEVTTFDSVPPEMETYRLNGGLYAVFDYKGLNTDNSIFQNIFSTWLPNSEYVLDNRPHFEVLGDKYKNNDPTSEEEIWIPIKLKC